MTDLDTIPPGCCEYVGETGHEGRWTVRTVGPGILSIEDGGLAVSVERHFKLHFKPMPDSFGRLRAPIDTGLLRKSIG